MIGFMASLGPGAKPNDTLLDFAGRTIQNTQYSYRFSTVWAPVLEQLVLSPWGTWEALQSQKIYLRPSILNCLNSSKEKGKKKSCIT